MFDSLVSPLKHGLLREGGRVELPPVPVHDLLVQFVSGGEKYAKYTFSGDIS